MERIEREKYDGEVNKAEKEQLKTERNTALELDS